MGESGGISAVRSASSVIRSWHGSLSDVPIV
jgi:hypothetical protein